MNKEIPKKVKNKKLLHELFPDLTSDEDLAIIEKWESKVRKTERTASGIVIPSDEIEIPEGFGDDFDVRELMKRAEDPVTGTMRNLRIDDRDLHHAKNFWDYSYNVIKKDANPPWARQMWTGLMLFGEICTACTKKKYLDVYSVPKDFDSEHIKDLLTPLEYGVCPKCKRHKWDLIKNHNLRDYIQSVGVIGQRGGKSSSTAGYATYIAHKYLKFPNLASLARSDMQASTLLTGTFVSLNLSKAVGVLWTPFKKMIEASKWFQSYWDILDDAKNKYGKDFYRNSTMYIDIYHKNMRFYPTGPNSATLRGDTRILACLVGDELVSTDRGLMRMDNASLKNLQVTIRKERHDITRHLRQGLKSVVRVKLSNGLWIDCTKDHLFEALMPDYSYKNIEAQHLEGTYLTVELGGLFGSGDLSNFEAPKSKHTYRYDLIKAMYKLQVFTKPDLEKMGIRFSSRMNIRMQRNGDLQRMRRRPDGYIPFALTPELTLDHLLSTYASGKILDKYRAKIPKRDSFALGYILGAFVADGSYNSKQEFCIGGLDKKRVLQVRRYIEEVFDFRYKIHTYKFHGRSAYRINIGTKNIRAFLVWLGLSPAIAHTKSIPWSVLQGSEDMIHGYLCGHLISDGTESSGRYVYSTKSRSLAKHLVTLLGHCRIHSGLKYHNEDGIYGVIVDPAFQARFANLIVSKLKIKKTKRGRTIDFSELTSLRDRLITFKAPYYSSVGQKNLMFYNRRLIDYKAELSRGRSFEEYPSKLQKLTRNTNKDTVYLQVVSVTPLLEKQETYDISVDSEAHLFKIGPGVITHNCLDELGLFSLPKGDEEEDSESQRANADEAHKSLMNSLATVQAVRWRLLKEGQSAVPPSVLMNVSSPISLRDKIMRLYRESKTVEGSKFILGINLPTWEANPSMERDTPLIAAAYASNPEKAERDFGANPPTVHSRFIPQKAYEEGVFVNGQNSHNFKYCFDNPGEVWIKVEKVRTVRWPSVVTIDAGHVNNSFCIKSFHYDFDTSKTVCSTVLECMPIEGRIVNFNKLYEHAILPILKDTNAVALLGDQWQGIDILYRAQDDMGNNPLGKPRCKSKQFSPRRKHFDTYVAMLQSRNLLYPTINEQDRQQIDSGNVVDYRTDMINKPVSHVYLQMTTVQDLGETRCPGKADGYTDDLIRAGVLGVLIHEPPMMDRLREAKDWTYDGQTNGRKMPMPAFAGRSGGGFRGLG